MKLVKETNRGFQYQLSPQEARSLRLLITQFPVAPLSAVKISKSDPEAFARERLLNESLAAHREELKRKAGELIAPDKFTESGSSRLFRISAQKRETMLQILNDIRVESWRALGGPENLETCALGLTGEKFKYYHFMHTAGFFEYHFLNLGGLDEK